MTDPHESHNAGGTEDWRPLFILCLHIVTAIAAILGLLACTALAWHILAGPA